MEVVTNVLSLSAIKGYRTYVAGWLLILHGLLGCLLTFVQGDLTLTQFLDCIASVQGTEVLTGWAVNSLRAAIPTA